MTKQQLSLIQQASLDSADNGMAWRKRMERWMEMKDFFEFYDIHEMGWIAVLTAPTSK